MEQEIVLLRELLTNLFQEEHSLANHDRATLVLLLSNRSELVNAIRINRKKRLGATRQLEQHLSLNKTGKKLPLEELLPQNHENTGKLLSLKDQMNELAKRTSLQRLRNEYLKQRLNTLPSICPPLPKKKSAIATEQLK
jgi:hypothetical protein